VQVLHLYQRSYEEARRFDPHGYKQPSVTVLDLKKKFPLRGSKTKTLPAVNGVSLSFQAGETFGLLGEPAYVVATRSKSSLCLRVLSQMPCVLRF